MFEDLTLNPGRRQTVIAPSVCRTDHTVPGWNTAQGPSVHEASKGSVGSSLESTCELAPHAPGRNQGRHDT